MKNEQEGKNQKGQQAAQNNREENDSNRMDVGHSNMDTDSYDEIADEADKIRTKKPGSQSNSGKQHNNGRGGGK